MMNYNVFGLCFLLRQLATIERDVEYRIKISDQAKSHGYAHELRRFIEPEGENYDDVNSIDRRQIDGLLQYAKQQADLLELQPVHDRLERFAIKLRHSISLHDYLAEVRTLRETFESGIQFKRFYLYPEAKAQLCIRAQSSWAAVGPGRRRAQSANRERNPCRRCRGSKRSGCLARRVLQLQQYCDDIDRPDVSGQHDGLQPDCGCHRPIKCSRAKRSDDRGHH
jgi:hypothetical protein